VQPRAPRERPESDADRLINQVVTLQLQPGSMYSENELADSIGCNRTKIRKLLQDVAQYGLLNALPRRGILVAPIQPLDASLVYEARIAIETQTARLAALRATNRQLEDLAELLQSQPHAAGPLGIADFLPGDSLLHLQIAGAAQNPLLQNCLAQLLPASSRLWYWSYETLNVVDRETLSHEEVVDAIVKRKPKEAEEAMATHLKASWNLLQRVISARWQVSIA
jgi:DNA-binding GntR family transcriptional regulator